jgi:hypothetical protein
MEEAGRYGAELVQDYDGLGLAGTPTQVATPPVTTLAHVGEAREVGGRGEEFVSCHPACLAGSPMTPVEGEAGRPGVRPDDHPTAAALLRPPSPAGGEGDRCRVWRQGGEERSFHDQG